MADRIYKIGDVSQRTGLGRERIRQLEVAGDFPQRFKIVEGGRVVGWSAAEVDAWIAARIASRTKLAAA